ncbi:uncharacterized protein K452DRAFT_253801 [Aplosporella prunicola CBS 121167]|uniref:Ketoreductase domain-containing protein n=1 Tax=Aplosporella prunicola CBS 121167 TaxID=1176127 RepID=A0A6A6B9J7_9PEZI|nr:uncharacterized protein K452DRAFT_253801 [Aplosporella prunicola CBS 121167]KAF2140043.1 hypothetical protein K452DRAFT_253801 [Aplosporella prunicola CBS 121167]
MHLAHRTYLISGASSGLGAATARTLHAGGASVALLDLNADGGEALARELNNGARGRARFFETDVTDSESIAAAVEAVAAWARESDAPIGGVLAGAGVGNPGLIVNAKNEPIPMSAVDFVLAINLRGTIDLIRQVVPHITQSPGSGPDNERGIIIMVSSSAAFDGQMGQLAYAASKGAVRSMTLPMARDLSRFGIRVVTIAPSLFESNMTALLSDKVRKSLERVMEFPKRAGRPDEFARLVRHVIENGMLNGEVIRLDGAMRMPSKL